MKRRLLVALGGAAALVALRPAAAQAPRVARVGLLSFASESAPENADEDAGFAAGMRELGYVEGRNLVIERRHGRGKPERLSLAAKELVQMKVDVIFAGGPAPMAAAMAATRSIPIVAVGGGDPVAEGWAASLARPGGNVTGLTVVFPELGPKQLELLKEALPQLKRVALLFAPAELVDWRRLELQMLAGARQLGLDLQLLPLRREGDIDAAFAAARRLAAQALLALSTNLIVAQRARLAARAIEHRLPAMGDFPLMTHSGSSCPTAPIWAT